MTSLVRRCAERMRRTDRFAHTIWPTRWRAACARLVTSRGQGTVEYVGIVIVIGVLLVALKAGMGDQGGTIAHKISKSVSDAIQNVMENGKGSKG